jgi:hypothetical protein
VIQHLSLRFQGPFSWTGERVPAVADCSLAHSAGLYLWTVETSLGELVQYVGETGRAFLERFEEHLRAQLAGQYSVHDVDALLEGRAAFTRPGSRTGQFTTACASFPVRQRQFKKHRLRGEMKASRQTEDN